MGVEGGLKERKGKKTSLLKVVMWKHEAFHYPVPARNLFLPSHCKTILLWLLGDHPFVKLIVRVMDLIFPEWKLTTGRLGPLSHGWRWPLPCGKFTAVMLEEKAAELIAKDRSITSES